ncbi:MAG: hypothetical protein Q9M30_06675 [Mariprofundaceae bacterium]|nr:hypothetical protein [Mariprofundaceae bacterium]
MLLQDALDGFVRTQSTCSTDHGQVAEACMEHLARYLVGYSDLFDEELVESEEFVLDEWEQQLDSHMSKLMEGDVEPPLSLCDLKLEQLEPGHIREFFAWYLPREQSGDASAVVEFAAVMRDWWQFLRHKGRLDSAQHLAFLSILAEVEPDAVRVVKAAHLLFHYVRLAHGMQAQSQGASFSRFAEGHARIAEIQGTTLWLHFDSQPERIGPVMLSPEIAALLEVGDVLDVELGLRGDAWMMVDIGPVYPVAVYVEAEEFEDMPKLT